MIVETTEGWIFLDGKLFPRIGTYATLDLQSYSRIGDPNPRLPGIQHRKVGHTLLPAAVITLALSLYLRSNPNKLAISLEIATAKVMSVLLPSILRECNGMGEVEWHHTTYTYSSIS